MISRARLLLGTLVSIRADCSEDLLAAAFAAIERVHHLMNVHSSDGDLAHINREAHRRSVSVDPWTFDVLKKARAVSEASDGAFDITLGQFGACFADVELLAVNRVRLRRRARLDLSGIAKGFAVDRAVEALRRGGARSGSVNAGGDLRVFGKRQTVRVRLPGAPQLSLALPLVREAAFATSGRYYGSHCHDPLTGAEVGGSWSVTVCAKSCVVADALTKAVAIAGPLPGLLRRFQARAFAIDGQGNLHAPRG
ncbi:MAG TPA: FAD:protein FMN transferase [Burkholderiales bacterium]|jgi:thiamine biosynthesis lipoprotein